MFQIIHRPRNERASTIIPTVFNMAQRNVEGDKQFHPTKGNLLPNFFYPLHLHNRCRPRIAPNAVHRTNSFTTRFANNFTIRHLYTPRTIRRPNRCPMQQRQHERRLVHFQRPLAPTRRPPQPLQAIYHRVAVQAWTRFFQRHLPRYNRPIAFVRFHRTTTRRPR